MPLSLLDITEDDSLVLPSVACVLLYTVLCSLAMWRCDTLAIPGHTQHGTGTQVHQDTLVNGWGIPLVPEAQPTNRASN